MPASVEALGWHKPAINAAINAVIHVHAVNVGCGDCSRGNSRHQRVDRLLF